MVKIINIDTKTRTIHVSNADGDIKAWRTTESGAHFPIKKGESTKEALDKFVEKKLGAGIDEKVPRNLPPELKKKEQESAEAREKLQKDLRKDVFGPAKKESQDLGKPGDNVKHVSEMLKTPKAKELYDRLGKYAKEHASELPLDHLEHLVALRKILLDDNNAAEHVEKNFQKWFGSSKQPKQSEPDHKTSRNVEEIVQKIAKDKYLTGEEYENHVSKIKKVSGAKVSKGEFDDFVQIGDKEFMFTNTHGTPEDAGVSEKEFSKKHILVRDRGDEEYKMIGEYDSSIPKEDPYVKHLSFRQDKIMRGPLKRF